MRRLVYLALGFLSLLTGGIGAFVPLLPTVPFMLLAAFFFARSSPRLEAWLVGHRHFGPHIRNWRERGAVSRRGKRGAYLGFAISAALGLWLLSFPWALVPVAAGVIGGAWMASRPEA